MLKVKKIIERKSNIMFYVISPIEIEDTYLPEYNIVLLEVDDWQKELLPWNYNGDGNEEVECSISQLERIVRETENKVKITKRYFVGYSLSALFGYYVLTKKDLFDGLVCCSGSFWLDGFVQYAKTNIIKGKKLYFSLGDKEAKAKNKLFQNVDKYTNEIVDTSKKYNDCIFELEKGGHFNDVAIRIIKGIFWIVKEH